MTDVDRYLAAFKAFAGNGAGRAPSWLKEIREGAIARFAELGFPTTKQEEWRFTSVAPIVDTPFSHRASRIPHPGLSEIGALLIGDGRGVCLAEGRYAPGLSWAAGRPAGVRVESLAWALAQGPGSELAREPLARHARWHDSPFAALNTAFLADGAFVHVPAGATLEQPLEVLFLSSGGPPTHRPPPSPPPSPLLIERGAPAARGPTDARRRGGGYWGKA